MKTTLNKIKQYSPCKNGYKKLLTYLGKTKTDDEPLYFSTILESNGLSDTIWCFRAAPEYNQEWRLFAVFSARQVAHLMLDSRSINALEVAEKFAMGNASNDELVTARSAALAAARDAAWDAASGAAGAAAGAAAWAAARDAARAAARDAAWAAARVAAWDAARDAAWDAALDAERSVQADIMREHFTWQQIAAAMEKLGELK